ncbi:hypothetical protein GF415_00265 [Candidatus Micrarchaeota archaeon]|nr:hypothetical protein [Candidatus Micrarchaeota archaeon]
MKIGYAYPEKKLLKKQGNRLSPKKIVRMGRENILRLGDSLEWNRENGISVFRIPLDTIPFTGPATSPEIWKPELDVEGQVVGEELHGMRVFMRTTPQYSMGSPDKGLARRSMAEIEHCAATMELLRLGKSSKIITNIGRVAGRRKDTARRFISNFRRLSGFAKERLVVENDRQHWAFYDAFGVAGKLKIPIVFNYPAFLKKQFTELSARDIISVASISWRKEDGPQKVHYSEFSKGKKRKTVTKKEFSKFYAEVDGMKVDIVLDTEEGRRSVLKALELTR